jgi:hypothetical protein
VRAAVLVGGFGVSWVVLVAPQPLVVIGVALTLGGGLSNAVLTEASQLVDDVAGGRVAEAFAWTTIGVTVGLAAGSALAGTAGASGGFAIAGGFALLTSVLAFSRPRETAVVAA